MIWTSLKKHLLLIGTLLLIFGIYLLHAPYTVQTGDSGELTAAATKLLVAHPPGYPFWIWINHLWFELTSFSSPFFSFAVFNNIQAVLCLILLACLIPGKYYRLLAIVILGLSPLFWKLAEIPEVFTLNVLLSFLVIYTGTLKGKIPNTKIPQAAILMPLSFSLGVANHQTIVFLLPFVAWVCWQHRKVPSLYLSTCAGVIICSTMYLSLLYMHPENIHSWGFLKNSADVFQHLIRADYGTFNLHSHSDSNQAAATALFYSKTILINIWPALVMLAITLGICFRKKQPLCWNPAWTTIALSVAAYSLIFIPMTQIPPVNFLADVLERFFILPISLLVFLISGFIAENTPFRSPPKKSFVLLTILIAACSFFLHSPTNDFSKNTIVEDYALNFLNNATTFKNPLILASSDTELFAIRYLQTVENIHPEILVGSIHQFKTGSFILKAKQKAPLLKLDYEKITTEKTLYVIEDLILPNSENFTIIADDDEYPPDLLRISVLPVGFMLRKGTGMDFERTAFTPTFRSDASIITSSWDRFSYFRSILTKYTYYFMIKGMYAAKEGDSKQAINYFNSALQIAPYAIPPLTNLCKIIKTTNQIDQRCETNSMGNNFDYFRFNNKRVQ